MADTNDYKSILKGTSIFGGVQFYNILISLVRGKFVALFLGPVGMGVSALYLTSTQTIQTLASLGLNLSIVKEIGANKENPDNLAHYTMVARRLICLTAFLGAILCVICSPWLSRFSFGDEKHIVEYSALGIFMFFSVYSMGQSSILQGVHDVRRLGKAGIVGSTVGLLTGVPLYYLFGISGIVPAMIILSLSTFLFYQHAISKSTLLSGNRECKFDRAIHLPIAKSMLLMGILLMVGTLIGNAVNYIILTYIRSFGDLKDVGLFQAASSMTSQYASVAFSALSMDFLPRLAAVAKDNKQVSTIVNRQTEIVTLIIAPLICLVFLFAPLIIRILLTSEYMVMLPLFRAMALATVMRALMYPMGFITFAKDNKKVFFWMEGIGCNILTLVLTYLGYRFGGLDGIGWAQLVDCTICFFLYYIVNHSLYGYRFTRNSLSSIIIAMLIVAGSYLLTYGIGSELLASGNICRTGIALIFTILAIAYSYITIKRKIKTQ